MQVLARSKGRNAIKAAAYRAGERLRDEGKGEAFDYSRRRGVVHTEILLPDGAPEWMADREKLWNHVEAIEKRRDAQVAREINIALPHELSAAERKELLLNFVREHFVRRGMVADVCFHNPIPEKGDSPQNFHAHVMLTMRQATSKGLRAVKTREWNSDELLNQWRSAWAEQQNRALERAGHRSRVDHRTLEAQQAEASARGDRAAAIALDRTPEIHVGPQAHQASKRNWRHESRNRQAGPYRIFGGDKARRRNVRYPSFDTGSRLQRNMAIVESNGQRFERIVDRLHVRLGAWRKRHQRLSKEEFAEQRAWERASASAARQREWQRRRDQEAVIRAMVNGRAFRWPKRKHRMVLMDKLIRDIDDVIRSLLGIRLQNRRRHAHLARGLSRERERSRGRER